MLLHSKKTEVPYKYPYSKQLAKEDSKKKSKKSFFFPTRNSSIQVSPISLPNPIRHHSMLHRDIHIQLVLQKVHILRTYHETSQIVDLDMPSNQLANHDDGIQKP